MAAKKKHPKKSSVIYRARVEAHRLETKLRMHILNLTAERTRKLHEAADAYRVPSGWTRIGLVLNDEGELCLWIGKGHGSKRRHKMIVLEA